MDASHLDNTGAPEVPNNDTETTSVRQDVTMIGGSGIEMGDLESCPIEPAHQTFTQYLGRSLPQDTNLSDIERNLSGLHDEDSSDVEFEQSGL
jgi:hypothetical protein